MSHSSVTRQKIGKNLTRKIYTSKTGKTSSVTVNTQYIGNGTTVSHYMRNESTPRLPVPKIPKSSSGSSSRSTNYSSGSGDDTTSKLALLIVGLVVMAFGALFAGLFAVGKTLYKKASEPYKAKQSGKHAFPAIENNENK